MLLPGELVLPATFGEIRRRSDDWIASGHVGGDDARREEVLVARAGGPDGSSVAMVPVGPQVAQSCLGRIQFVEREESSFGQVRLAGVLVEVRPDAGHLEYVRECRVDRAVIVEPLLEAVGIFERGRRSLPDWAAWGALGIASQRPGRSAGIAGHADRGACRPA